MSFCCFLENWMTHCQDSPSHFISIFCTPSWTWCMMIAGNRSSHFSWTHTMLYFDHLISDMIFDIFFSSTFSESVTWDVISQHMSEDCFLITELFIKCCLHFDFKALLSERCHRHLISSSGCASAAYVVMYIERAIFNLCTGLMTSALYWQPWINFL